LLKKNFECVDHISIQEQAHCDVVPPDVLGILRCRVIVAKG
jgi:hypothetical protein